VKTVTDKNSNNTKKKRPPSPPAYIGMDSDPFQSQKDVDELEEMIQQRKRKLGMTKGLRRSEDAGLTARENWIFPIAEGVCVDTKTGRWSDGAFFDDEDTQIEWYQAEPAPHVQDREVWRRWLEFLETSSTAAETLLTVAKSRARARVEGLA
jgi:hypothetical protein